MSALGSTGGVCQTLSLNRITDVCENITVIITLLPYFKTQLDAKPHKHGLIAGLFRVSSFSNLGGGVTDDPWTVWRVTFGTFDDRRGIDNFSI